MEARAVIAEALSHMERAGALRSMVHRASGDGPLSAADLAVLMDMRGQAGKSDAIAFGLLENLMRDAFVPVEGAGNGRR